MLASRNRRPKARLLYWVPLVGMVNDPAKNCSLERVLDQLGVDGRHRPAGNGSGEDVGHASEAAGRRFQHGGGTLRPASDLLAMWEREAAKEK